MSRSAVGKPAAASASRRALRVGVRIGAHEEPAGVAQQEEPARLEEVLHPVAGPGILLGGFETHRAVPAAGPAPLVQEGGDGFRVELHAGG